MRHDQKCNTCIDTSLTKFWYESKITGTSVGWRRKTKIDQRIGQGLVAGAASMVPLRGRLIGSENHVAAPDDDVGNVVSAGATDGHVAHVETVLDDLGSTESLISHAAKGEMGTVVSICFVKGPAILAQIVKDLAGDLC